MLDRVKIVIWDIYQSFSKNKVTKAAAALSYYLTLSFFPFLICLNTIIGFFDIDIWDIARVADGLLPQNTLDVIESYMMYISRSQSTAFLIAGGTMFITSIAAAFRSILGTLEDINGTKRYKGIIFYITGFVFAVTVLFGTYLCMLASVLSKSIVNFIDKHTKFTIVYNDTLPFLILFAYLFIILSALYKLSLPKGVPVKKVWIGALFSSVGVALLSGLFSVFLEYSTKYSLVYGSLASVMLVMVWMFVCGIIIILGAVLNHALNEASKHG